MKAKTQTKTLWRISVATSLEAEDAVTELLADLTGETAASYHYSVKY